MRICTNGSLRPLRRHTECCSTTFDLDVAAAAEGFQRVLADRPQGHVELHGIGLDRGSARARRVRQIAVSCRAQRGRKSATRSSISSDQLDRLEFGPRRPGEEHHVGDHLVDPHRLGADQRQRVLALGIGLFAQQELAHGRR